MKRSRRITAALAIVAGAVLLSGCGYDVPSDMAAVHMGNGPFENKSPKGCIKPGTHSNSITNDTYALFPVSEREWDATGQKGSDASPFTSVTHDNVEMKIPVTIRFTLDTDCKTLTDFYLKYARRYGVSFDSSGHYNSAWETLLRKLIADPADATLDRIVQNYNWRDVWNNPETRVEIEKQLNDQLAGSESLINRQAKGNYFEGITVLVSKPDVVNADLKQAIADEQNSVAKAQAQKAQADADRATAEAQAKVAQAEALKQKAEIAGYGSVEAYLKAQCIAQGCNPWQPTYVVPGATPPTNSGSNK